MVAHSGLITVMQKAARKAAPRLRRDFGEVEQLQVSRKGPADFVSMADKRAEQTIVEELRIARPDWGLLLEEGGEIAGNPDKPRWSKIYAAVGPQVSGVRRFGSAALDLAWVAAGRMDGFWEDDLDLWDTAAGVLLVKEAGGFVTDYRGADRCFERGEYVAGSSAI